MKKRNGFIEIERFIFCFVILFSHSGFFGYDDTDYLVAAGYLAVDFFFILTGYFAMKKVAEFENCPPKPMAYSVKYTVNKLLRVFPYALVGTLIAYAWRFLQSLSAEDISGGFYGLLSLPFELLFLPMTGVISVNVGAYVNTPLWYISVILIVLPLVMYVAIKCKDVYASYLCWIVPLMLHGYMLNKFGSLGSWGFFDVFTFTGVVKGLSDIMLGTLLFVATDGIGKLKSNKPIVKSTGLKILFSLVEVACIIFFLALNIYEVNGYAQETALLALLISLSISLSGLSFSENVGGKFSDFLGIISLPMYCMHWGIYQIVAFYTDGYPYGLRLVIGICATFAVSLAVLLIWKRISRKKSRV